MDRKVNVQSILLHHLLDWTFQKCNNPFHWLLRATASISLLVLKLETDFSLSFSKFVPFQYTELFMTLFPLFAGTLASLLHVISGPDHLAAVTPLAIETKRKAWKIGLFWGIGHLLGMLLIGVLFLFFKDIIPVESISEHSEQLVAYVLIGVGAWALFRLFRDPKKHKHHHVHSEKGAFIHAHEHNHSDELTDHTHKKEVKQSVLSAFGIGFLHGLAGVAHFLLLLPALGFEKQIDSVIYIIGFAIGTVLAMTVYAFVLGKVASLSKKRDNEVFFKGVRFAGGMFAVLIGFYWLYLTF